MIWHDLKIEWFAIKYHHRWAAVSVWPSRHHQYLMTDERKWQASSLYHKDGNLWNLLDASLPQDKFYDLIGSIISDSFWSLKVSDLKSFF